MDAEIVLKTLITNKKDREFYLNCIDNGISLNEVVDLNDTYNKFKNLFEVNKIRPSNFINHENPKEGFSTLYNQCNQMIVKSKANKKMRSFFSNKHKHIINDKTKELFCELIDLNVSDVFYEGFRKKVSAFKTADSLNESLLGEITTIKEWKKPEKLIQKINNNGGHVIEHNDNTIIMELTDYKAAKALGTQMWCICREESTFIEHQSDVDRVFFKYDTTKEVTDIQSMTAYIVNADGSVKAGYYKDDEIMTDSELSAENVNFNAYSFNDYQSRYESNGHSDGSFSLMTYNHNMDEQMKDLDMFTPANSNDLQTFLEKNQPNTVLSKIYKDKDIVLDDQVECLTVWAKYLESQFSHDTKDFLIDILKDKDYRESADFKNRTFIETINNNLYLDHHKDYQELFDLLDVDLHQEIANTVNLNKPYLMNTGVYKLAKEQNIDVFEDVKDNPEILFSFVQKDSRTLNSIFGGEKNAKELFSLIEPLASTASLHVIESLKADAAQYNIEFLGEDAENKALLSDIVKRPNTLFVKIKKLDAADLHLDYNQSMSIMKTLFLDDDLDFSKYEKTYLMDDVMEASMNSKTKDFVLTHERFDDEARRDFFKKVNEFKEFSDDETQIKFDVEYGDFLKTPVAENTVKPKSSKNKL